MEIKYKNNKLEKECTNYLISQRKYGKEMAFKIFERINQLISANSIEDLLRWNIGRCHKLKGDKKDFYSMDLIHPFRIVFTKSSNITVIIIEIIDYH